MTVNEFGKKSYAYAVGAIKATSHPPLPEEAFRRLAESDVSGFRRVLDEFGWGRGIEGSIPERIDGEMKYAVDFIKDISPDKSLTDLLLFEEDAENLKLFLKGRLIGRDVSDMACDGSIPVEVVRASVEAGDFSLMGEEIDLELRGIENEKDPFVISMKADRAVFAQTLKDAKKKKASLYQMLLKYGEAKNRISQARLRRLGALTEDIESLLLPVKNTPVSADQRNDDEIIAEAKESIARAMYDLRQGENFAPIAEYFFSKKSEAARLRLLFAECELKSINGEAQNG